MFYVQNQQNIIEIILHTPFLFNLNCSFSFTAKLSVDSSAVSSIFRCRRRPGKMAPKILSITILIPNKS